MLFVTWSSVSTTTRKTRKTSWWNVSGTLGDLTHSQGAAVLVSAPQANECADGIGGKREGGRGNPSKCLLGPRTEPQGDCLCWDRVVKRQRQVHMRLPQDAREPYSCDCIVVVKSRKLTNCRHIAPSDTAATMDTPSSSSNTRGSSAATQTDSNPFFGIPTRYANVKEHCWRLAPWSESSLTPRTFDLHRQLFDPLDLYLKL